MFYTILLTLLISCVTVPESPQPVSLPKSIACDFFGYENAVKIIGERARGTDNEAALDDGGRQWGCTYSSATTDGPKLYFLLIRNNSEDAAKKAFDDMRQSNKNHQGFEEWPGVGEEAIVHTDGSGFQFIMARDGAKTIRIKVSPIRRVSFDDVKAVARSLTAKLK